MVYTVWMTNFNMRKGSFNTLDEAINHAKALGFECHIVVDDGTIVSHVCNVKPY